MADIDIAGLKDNFATVATNGEDVPLFFYSYLFVKYPQTRDMFPISMSKQRDRLVGALVRIVSNVDKVGELVPYLQDLGRDHRKFGALTAHYAPVGESLLATLKHFSGDSWTDKLEADWAAAYGIVADTMSGAAEKAAETEPAWWEGEIVEVDRRTFDIAVIRAVTSEPIPYIAGQSLSVEPRNLRPREWRWYTPANPPGGLDLEFHVRLIDGGPVSAALVLSAKAGDQLRLGPPFGRMFRDPDSRRPVLMVAGSTGLAPMKAMIDQLAREGGRPTTLYFGARTVREIYDRKALERLQATHSWLDVVIATSDDDSWAGRSGLICDVVTADGDWSGHDAFVCGSPQMAEATVKALVASGVPEVRIKFEEYGER